MSKSTILTIISKSQSWYGNGSGLGLYLTDIEVIGKLTDCLKNFPS